MNTILSIVAGIVLAVLSNWLYDIFKTRRWLPDNPTLKRIFLTLVVFSPLVILVALPSLNNTQDTQSTDPTNNNSQGITSSTVIQGNKGNVTINQLPSKTEKSKVRLVSYSSIPNQDLLINRFKLPQGKVNVSLRFISQTWNIDFSFLVSENTKFSTVKDALLETFDFQKYTNFDLSEYPTEEGCEYLNLWRITVNGQLKDDASKSLKELGIRDRDILGLTTQWGYYCNVTYNGEEKIQFSKTPPTINH